MPKFTVVAIEEFSIRTTYYGVEADSAAEAEESCRSGNESYSEHSILDEPGTWVSTQSVEEEIEYDATDGGAAEPTPGEIRSPE